MTRRFFVWVHRWVGLLMTLFLMVVGITGALLAFSAELERWINPQLFVDAVPGRQPLDLASLADKADALAAPFGRVGFFAVELHSPQQVSIAISPTTNPDTGKPYALDFDRLFLDPYTGAELGRRREGDVSQGRINWVPFLLTLHTSLAAGSIGSTILGVVALAWTLDCLWSVYLTLPAGRRQFFRRWSTSFKLKWKAAPVRIHYDLHRAGGLWLWPLLLVFAWSSVMFNLPDVYEQVTSALFGYSSVEEVVTSTLHPVHATEHPKLDWHDAQRRGEALVSEQARTHGFVVEKPFGIGYLPSQGVYTYEVRTNQDVGAHTWQTGVWIDGDTGALQKVFLPHEAHLGDTISTWLYALHWADFHGWLVYRVLVSLLGIVIVMLCVTGVYICWKKRYARRFAQRTVSIHWYARTCERRAKR